MGKQPKCDLVAWILGGAKFTTVPGKPRKDQVPISRSQYVAAKTNPKCVHCTPHSPCYRSARPFPRYFKSGGAWKNPKFKDYMLNGPIAQAITAIPGLTAYVCRVSGHEVSKWLKFDNAKALSAFKAWAPKQFNPKTMFTPHLRKVCSLKDGGFLKQPKCDLVAWRLGGAKFTTVPGKPRKDQVPISRSQYVAAKTNPKCVHCTPHSPCYRSAKPFNYTKKHTAFVK